MPQYEALVQLWMVFGPFVAACGFGALYMGISFVLLICMNLGQRKPGEASAYSIFNDGFRRLPGSSYHFPGSFDRTEQLNGKGR